MRNFFASRRETSLEASAVRSGESDNEPTHNRDRDSSMGYSESLSLAYG